MMSRDIEKELLQAMATEIGHAAKDLPAEPLTGFLAIKGKHYHGDLMWVGRAVNGWMKGYVPAQLQDVVNSSGLVEAVAANALGAGVEGPCPLQWVSHSWGDRSSKYNTARSAFWRMAKRISLAGDSPAVNEQNWPSHMVWSNLYKFAPEKGWNPSAKVAKLQRARCRELLLRELATFQPKRLVFATGMDWFHPFSDASCFVPDPETPHSKYAQCAGTLALDGKSIGRFVVAMHPMGKNEARWSKEVLDGLDNPAF